jgi:hypothetical protein
MDDYVSEFDLLYDAIIERFGPFTQGDEDFDVFKCPRCKRIYVIEYEGETIFVSPDDPSELRGRAHFSCLTCRYEFPDDKPIIGPRADPLFKVRRSELLASPWHWLVKRSDV